MELTEDEKDLLLKRVNELKKTVKYLNEEQIPAYEKELKVLEKVIAEA